MATVEELKQAIVDLQAKVTAETEVGRSAVLLLGELSQLLKDALASGGTPQEVIDQIATIAQQVDVNAQELAAAVTANTPAEAPSE